MQGNTEQHQLTLIAQLCGTITPESWPGVENLDLYNKMELPLAKMPNSRNVENLIPKQFAASFLSVSILSISSFL